MPIAEISVDLDQAAIEKFINERLDQALRQTLFFWDINRMSEMISMSKSFIEEEFLHDNRMKLLERRKPKGKRVWPVAESLEVIRAIMDEW